MSETGQATRRALLDAAQELLVFKGLSEITTRKVAERAGVNQALVHYHFGSIEELLIAVLERVSASVRERSERIYAEQPFLDGWFQEVEAMTTGDVDRGWGKIWLENLTLAANRSRVRDQYVRASSTVRRLHEERAGQMLRDLGLNPAEYPPTGIVTLLDAVAQKLILDRLVGIDTGHREALAILRRLWSRWLVGRGDSAS